MGDNKNEFYPNPNVPFVMECEVKESIEWLNRNGLFK